MTQARQVRRSRTCVQLLEQAVVTLLALAPGDFTVWIIQVAKDNRLGGAGLLASGYDLAIPQRAVLFFCFDLGRVDPLDAVAALFHDAAAAHADVGIANSVKTLRVPVRIQIKIKA